MPLTVTKSQMKAIDRQLQPLIKKGLIKKYSYVEKPKFKETSKYQLIYTDDTLRRHHDIIVDELRKRNIDYNIIETKNQNGKRLYQLIINVNGKQLDNMVEWLQPKVTERNEIIQFFDASLNPTATALDVMPLHGAENVPDLRIRNRARYKDFKKAEKIIVPIDHNSHAVILSTVPMKTQQIKKSLSGERLRTVLVQDFRPSGHSQSKSLSM